MTHRCLADIGGPFYDLNKPFRNWSALPFYQLDLPQPPYVDQRQLDWGITRAIAYLNQIHAQGYTGIVVDNLAHLVTFERSPVAIYPPGSPFRLRAAIYRAAFCKLFDAAIQLGMEVFITSDMQWSTPPLRAYVGRMAADNPRLAEVNRWAIDELFAELPQVRGLVVRTGETGGSHNQGSSYAGHMLYTSADSMRGLIGATLRVCERHNRLLIVRTWSIGIGALGDLLWSPERYQAVFGGFNSPHLLTSIKHAPSDFFRLQPHNPTLGLPGPEQIIELQNRREYELFGMTPSSIIELHQGVVRHAQGTNNRFAGVWAWNATGGWGGGSAALGSDGWSSWTELNSALTAALVHTPELDAKAFAKCWCAETFGQTFGEAVAEVYLESAELIERGWYHGQQARNDQQPAALYMPSLLWVWWMRPTASLAVWAYIASLSGDRAATEHGSATAAARLRWHSGNLAALAPAGDQRAAAIAQSVGYLADVVGVAHGIRTLMGRAFEAAWHGRRAEWSRVAQSAPAAWAVIRRHRAAWAGNTHLPPLELDEIEAFLGSLEHAPGRLWVQARAACILVRQLQSGSLPRRHAYMAGAGAATLLLLALAHRRSRPAGIAGVLTSLLLAPPLRQRAIKATLPWLSRHLYLLPSIFFETGPSFTEWTA